MMLPRFVAWMFMAGTMVLGVGVVSGQSFPNKPVHIIVSQPGGAADFAARLVAQGISGPLGQNVIVENRGGGGGIIAIEAVAKAPPDGYTLLLLSNAVWTLPLMKNVTYDPVRDFSPITLAAIAPSILVVHPSLPVHSVKELIALAKARPRELNYGSGGPASPNQIAGELFKSMAGGLKITEVPFKGGGPAIIAVLGGEVPLMFASTASVASHIKSGRLRALAITSAEPSALLPGIPTVAASGLPGYDAVTIYCIFAPAKTPSTVVNRLNQEIVRALGTADVKQKFFAAGIEVVGSSPEQLAARVRSEISTMSKVIKDADIRAD